MRSSASSERISPSPRRRLDCGGDEQRLLSTQRGGLGIAKLEYVKRAHEAPMTARPEVTGFFHARTFSIAYIVADPATKRAAFIDPVLDYDERAGRVGDAFADALLAAVKEKGLKVEWILDTHPHADHFSAAPYLKEKLGAPTAIGEHVKDVQLLWKGIYNLPDFPADGSQWDRLFADGDTFKVGSLERARDVLARPYARLDHLCRRRRRLRARHAVPAGLRERSRRLSRRQRGARSIARSGDPGTSRRYAALHRPRLSCRAGARCASRARSWSRSGRTPTSRTIRARRNSWRFATSSTRRSPMPRLILHALQVNMNGGRLPAPEANGRVYLKIPIGAL